ncbi:MAG: MgtC/SapB family protein [Deltaproteobacteria bacterium]|nr:MgtC/SapB family protein [Deltaproteobacteria bacterium]
MDIDWRQLFTHLYHLAIAYGLAFPIGWDREVSKRKFGIRTFPLVAVVTCGYMLTGMYVLDSSDAEARVIQGLMTGIGFIGGGAILKNKDEGLVGTASAASIWNMGAVGMAVAFDRYEIAIALAIINFITLRVLGMAKNNDGEENDGRSV